MKESDAALLSGHLVSERSNFGPIVICRQCSLPALLLHAWIFWNNSSVMASRALLKTSPSSFDCLLDSSEIEDMAENYSTNLLSLPKSILESMSCPDDSFSIAACSQHSDLAGLEAVSLESLVPSVLWQSPSINLGSSILKIEDGCFKQSWFNLALEI